MIKFFRHIRKKLLGENRFSKYLFYAFGEIILVVIGILIALQINNWKEERKLRNTEIETLREIKDDLKITRKELENDLEAHISALEANNQLIEFLKFDKKPDRTIGHLFSLGTVDMQAYPKTSGYNLLQSKGVNIISNDSLRNKIVDLYQLNFKRVVELGKLNSYNDIYKILKPYVFKHFESTNSPYYSRYEESIKDSINYYKIKTISLDKIKQDNAFQIDLEHVIEIRFNKVYAHKNVISQIESILSEIDKELNKK